MNNFQGFIPSPETNIAPENGWLEYDCFLLGLAYFERLILSVLGSVFILISNTRMSSICPNGFFGIVFHQTGFLDPRGSMYGTFTYIYHKNEPNVGKYTIHGSYGDWNWGSHFSIHPPFRGPKTPVEFRFRLASPPVPPSTRTKRRDSDEQVIHKVFFGMWRFFV